ncbi:MAG: hypothetical protein GY803_17585 [Chloroflexi bacterium]|nr:hypothetical protein [Chloroflexota bacterium]
MSGGADCSRWALLLVWALAGVLGACRSAPAPPTLMPAAYPVLATAVPQSYPATATATAAPPSTISALPIFTSQTFLPIIINNLQAISPAHPPAPTPPPRLDFAAIRADLRANGQELAYNKIGFHAGVNGTMDGLEAWMRELDTAGVPFFIKTADNAEPVYIAQELMKQSGVPHTLVYRKAAGGDDYNVPFYDLPPEEAARIHWEKHIAAFPPELDPSLVWLETVNEVDKNRSEWLAQFALATAQLALRDGYKWAAFGWASGEPEPEDWQSPAMLEFLRLAAANPDRLAVALHEYSYEVDDIYDQYPFKIGRFLELFRICDRHGIPRPTVLITEWGWTYEHVPEPEPALRDIEWAARLYAPFPQVKGAAIWFLGGGYGDIEDETQRLIQPVTEYSLLNYFAMPQFPNQSSLAPEQYRP